MFPLKKRKVYFNDSTEIATVLSDVAEIPVGDHLGAFGVQRKNHIHEGVDIYCQQGDEVFAMECGEIVKIIPFTGQIAGSPWWNNTYCVVVKHKNFYANYGEIIPLDDLFVGQKLKEGNLIGYVTPVLKEDKGRPMSMLHLEMYKSETSLIDVPTKSWDLDQARPNGLLNPTGYLIKYLTKD